MRTWENAKRRTSLKINFANKPSSLHSSTNPKRLINDAISRLIHLTFRHKFKDVVERAAHQYMHALQKNYGNYIVGPAEPVIGRIRNQYLMEFLF